VECAAGHYASTCVECAAGKYSMATDATSEDTCAPCASGKYSMATGATSEDTCVPCAADRFSTAGASACLCPHGQDTVDANAACLPCAVGTYFQKFAINILAPVIDRYAVRGIYHPSKNYADDVCSFANGAEWRREDGAFVLCRRAGNLLRFYNTNGYVSCFVNNAYEGSLLTDCTSLYSQSTLYYQVLVRKSIKPLKF
jgi:hypothetical protein